MLSFSVIRRGAAVLALLAAFAYGLLVAQLFIIGENPIDYHVDPLLVKSASDSNSYLVAPYKFAQALPHAESPEFDVPPADLMIAFDNVASNAPRTKLAAGAASELWATYVQRTQVLRFPDYVSVVAIGLPDGGSTLAIYSRSVYGNRDLGVNKARVERWLGELSKAVEKVRLK